MNQVCVSSRSIDAFQAFYSELFSTSNVLIELMYVLPNIVFACVIYMYQTYACLCLWYQTEQVCISAGMCSARGCAQQ